MPTPTVDQIPRASEVQSQLALIETALDALQAKPPASITNLTVTTQPSSPNTVGTATRVILDPVIEDASVIANTITMLEQQQTGLIAELESLGFTYTGSAIPQAAPAPTGPGVPVAMPPPEDPPVLPDVSSPIPDPDPAPPAPEPQPAATA